MFKCKHEHCNYGPESTKSFKSARYLNYHMKNVHGAQKIQCSDCRQKFALQWQLTQHQNDCGQSYKCTSCDKTYTRVLSMITHCKRHKHRLPDDEVFHRSKLPKTNTAVSQTETTAQVQTCYIVLQPVIVAPPESNKKSVATDTSDLELLLSPPPAILPPLHHYHRTPSSMFKATDTQTTMTSPRSPFFNPRMQNTETQTTLITEYDQDDVILRDQFLPYSTFSQSVQTETASNSFQSSQQTQTGIGREISTQASIQTQIDDDIALWNLEFNDNQTQTVWAYDQHTQT